MKNWINEMKRNRMVNGLAILSLLFIIWPPVFVMTANENMTIGEHLESDAKTVGTLLGRFAARNPEVWMHKHEHLQNDLQGIYHTEHYLLVLDAQRQTIFELGQVIGSNSISREAPFFIAGQPAGFVRLEHSNSEFISRALARSMFGLLLTALVILGFRKYVLQPQADARRRQVETTQRLEMASNAASIGVWELDLATSTLTWDRQMHIIFDLPPEKFGGKMADFMSLIHPDDLPIVGALAEQAIKTGELTDWEFRILCRDGAVRTMEGHGQCYYNADGSP